MFVESNITTDSLPVVIFIIDPFVQTLTEQQGVVFMCQENHGQLKI